MEHVITIHEETSTSLSIPLYIVHCILPKCAMVYGEIFSSTYLQIALHTHNNLDKKFDEYDISSLIDYHVRTIRNTIKKMLELNLIKTQWIGQKKQYQIVNHNINQNEIGDFIKSFDEHILLDATNQIKTQQQFALLNHNILNTFKDITKTFNIVDIEKLRKKIQDAEVVYKGSSLFYLSFLTHQQLGEKDGWMSEKDRSLMVGCSQPTLSRYIEAYEKHQMIKKTKQNKYYALSLCNFTFDDINTNHIIEKEVVNKMNDEIICPICNKDCLSITSFATHLSRSKDIKHKVIAQFKQDNDLDVTKLLKHIRKVSIEAILSDLIVDEPSNISPQTTSKEQTTNQTSNKPEKTKKTTKKQKVKNAEINFDELPDTIENPKTLVAYFHDELVKDKSTNFPKEAAIVKRSLDNGLSAEIAKKVLEYMYKRGQVVIQNFSAAVKDYYIYEDYLKNVEKEGTAAFLLKRFYDGFGLSINMQGFVKEIAKINASVLTEGYENTKYIIDYMVQKKTTNIHYISSMRLEALENKKKNGGITPNTSKNSSIDNNPAFRDQEDIVFIQSSLLSADKKISDIPPHYKDVLMEFLKKSIVDGKISPKFSGFEWAWRVGLELDEETYLACEKLERPTMFDRGINMYLSQNNIDMYNKVLKKKKKFDDWLQKQHDLFGFCKQHLN